MLAQRNKHPRDDYVTFTEKGHLYTLWNGKHPTSVTTLLGKCFPSFDAKRIANFIVRGKNYMTGEYAGMTVDQIVEHWSKNGKEASDKGSYLHKEIELYLNGEISWSQNPDFPLFLSFWKHFTEANPNWKVYRTEWIIFDEEGHVAGSIDLTLINEHGQLALVDWKRSKEIYIKSKDGTFGYGELCHLENSNLNKYRLQLNCYRHIIEKNYGFEVVSMFIVALHPNNALTIEVPRMEREIKYIWSLQGCK